MTRLPSSARATSRNRTRTPAAVCSRAPTMRTSVPSSSRTNTADPPPVRVARNPTAPPALTLGTSEDGSVRTPAPSASTTSPSRTSARMGRVACPPSTRKMPAVPSVSSARNANCPPSFMAAPSMVRKVPPSGVTSPTPTTWCSRAPSARKRPSRPLGRPPRNPTRPSPATPMRRTALNAVPLPSAALVRTTRRAAPPPLAKMPLLPSSRMAANAISPPAP